VRVRADVRVDARVEAASVRLHNRFADSRAIVETQPQLSRRASRALQKLSKENQTDIPLPPLSLSLSLSLSLPLCVLRGSLMPLFKLRNCSRARR